MVKGNNNLTIIELLSDVVKQTNKGLEGYWSEEKNKEYGFDSGQKEMVKKILDHVSDHNLRGGKRVRAFLVYLGYLLNSEGVDKRLWKVMEGVELVHTALLIHDDFIDEDKLRRGSVTTHEYFAQGDKHYGDCMAVNAGDIVLNLGYERILDSGFEADKLLEVGKHLMRGIAETAYGQAYDVSLPKLGKMNSEAVLAVQWTKTAIYTFENPLWIGAKLGDSRGAIFDLIKEFSEKVGIAFQMQDDILGVFGDSEKTGKSDDSDLHQKKITLLITKVLEIGTEEQKNKILEYWKEEKIDDISVAEIKKIIVESGALIEVEEKIKKLSGEALEILERMKEVVSNKQAVVWLKELVEYMVKREK